MDQRHLLVAAAAVGLVALAPVHGHAGDGKSALRLMPENTALVMSFNVSRARTSATGKLLIAGLAASDDFARAARKLRDKTGFDINRDVDTVVMGMASDVAVSGELVILVEGRFHQAKLLSVIKEASSSFKRRKHRNVAYYTMDGERALAFLDGYLIMAPSKVMPGIIDAHERKAGSARDHAALMTLINAGDTSKDLWAAFVTPAELRQEIGKQTGGHSIDAIMGTIDMHTGLRVRARMNTNGKQAAAAITTFLRMTLSELASDRDVRQVGLDSLINKLTIRKSGARIDMRIDLSDAELGMLEGILGRIE